MKNWDLASRALLPPSGGNFAGSSHTLSSPGPPSSEGETEASRIPRWEARFPPRLSSGGSVDQHPPGLLGEARVGASRPAPERG